MWKRGKCIRPHLSSFSLFSNSNMEVGDRKKKKKGHLYSCSLPCRLNFGVLSQAQPVCDPPSLRDIVHEVDSKWEPKATTGSSFRPNGSW